MPVSKQHINITFWEPFRKKEWREESIKSSRHEEKQGATKNVVHDADGLLLANNQWRCCTPSP